MYGVFSSGKQSEYMPDSTYALKQDQYDKFTDSITRAKPFHIWSFEQIGLFDPYPDEEMETNFNIPKTDEDYVYRLNRYVQEYSPNAIYFPSKMVLFKIMRACIGVDDPKKLWFNLK